MPISVVGSLRPGSVTAGNSRWAVGRWLLVGAVAGDEVFKGVIGLFAGGKRGGFQRGVCMSGAVGCGGRVR